MKTGHNGIEMIKREEGLRLASYTCPAGVWTIGYGTTHGIKPGMKITAAQAEAYLVRDLAEFEKHVNQLVTVDVTQNQFDALISFTYNLGEGALGKSTLLKKVNADPHDATISAEFEKWCKAGGKVLAGLLARRKHEAKLYFS